MHVPMPNGRDLRRHRRDIVEDILQRTRWKGGRCFAESIYQEMIRMKPDAESTADQEKRYGSRA
jgi:hypothetical protein